MLPTTAIFATSVEVGRQDQDKRHAMALMIEKHTDKAQKCPFWVNPILPGRNNPTITAAYVSLYNIVTEVLYSSTVG